MPSPLRTNLLKIGDKMPASHEKIPNRPLAGNELVQIIERDVHDILTRDGMFTQNIAFGRVSYEIRVSLHLDNPLYPQHVSTVMSRPASKQQIAADPALAAVEYGPLVDPLTEDETVFAQERHREIQSPNAARVENGMPLILEKKNLDTGAVEQVQQMYKGDMPDPLSVGNLIRDDGVSDDQRQKWDKPKKVRAK